jgi:hypothetical protein
VPSDREQWGVYSPAGTATAPFTFFYKDNDTTAPTITLSAPTDGATYTAGDSVAASYGCADDGQVASCAGPVANGAAIDTASAGTKTFTVDATDGQGNHASKTVTYTVVAAAPAPAPPATPEPPVVAPPVPVKQSLHATVTVLRSTAKLHRGRKPRLVTGIVVSCPAGLPQSCGGSGKVTANVPARLTARTVTIGKLGFAVKPGTSHTVVINLTPRGARILARIHSVRITLAVTTHGQDGKRIVTTRRVTLRLR